MSGAGGDGCVSFRREKYIPRGGPDGGAGGNGGSVLLRGTDAMHTLLDFKYSRVFTGERGTPGSGNRKTGKNGKDRIIKVPAGTVVEEATTGAAIGELLKEGDELLVVRGGQGGRGNISFTTSTNRAPRKAQPGQPGAYRKLILELKLIADVGIVGLPNAGKSTLLSSISEAKPKIASYPFTTLTPNLGIVKTESFSSFTATDIPGLIKGAHAGKGLGHTFLRHVERTGFLLFLVDLTSADPLEDYYTILRELKLYKPTLLKKERVLVFNKIDEAASETNLPENLMNNIDDKSFIISALRGDGVKELVNFIASHLRIEEE